MKKKIIDLKADFSYWLMQEMKRQFMNCKKKSIANENLCFNVSFVADGKEDCHVAVLEERLLLLLCGVYYFVRKN